MVHPFGFLENSLQKVREFILQELVVILLKTSFERLEKVIEAFFTLCKRVAHDLDDVWQELVGNLGEEHLPSIPQG